MKNIKLFTLFALMLFGAKVFGQEEPSPELCAINSLMWHQPDNALAYLLPYFDTKTIIFANETTT